MFLQWVVATSQTKRLHNQLVNQIFNRMMICIGESKTKQNQTDVTGRNESLEGLHVPVDVIRVWKVKKIHLGDCLKCFLLSFMNFLIIRSKRWNCSTYLPNIEKVIHCSPCKLHPMQEDHLCVLKDV